MNTLIEISNPVYYVICAVLSILVLVGIAMMSKVKTAARGNALSATAMGLGVIVTLLKLQVVTLPWLIGGILIGGIIGTLLYTRVKMIQMPQMVALLNGIGGGASALVGALTLFQLPVSNVYFTLVTAFLAIIIGMLTLVGSLVAAGKLHRVLPQKSVVWPFHNVATSLTLIVAVFFLLIGTLNYQMPNALIYAMIGTMLFSALFGLYFSIRVGGADMPITISLLNSLSGVAGAIAGMAIGDIFLVAVGGVVGASGLLLTQIMCRAMNRSLVNILIPHGKAKAPAKAAAPASKASTAPQPKQESSPIDQAVAMLRGAKRVIIVPGYGMALAQAQQQVKQLADKLARGGADVKYAIHPVAGRMPGHMNVLLAEANVDYDSLYEMEAINDQFANTDAVIVIGANDVLNPAARNAEGTPIYGMPVLNVDQAKQVIICNFDLKPGYAGVENPLYSRGEGVALCLGDAKATIDQILSGLESSAATAQPASSSSSASDPISQAAGMLRGAKRVIIVPGYGMALAQAQQEVKQLADKLAKSGADVKYAIHPVAGRMPGHMNVLLAEANVDYDSLYEMEAINDQFANTDAVIVIGANDVLNPAARNAEGTPIYGMPVLNVDQAKQVIICNFDLKPGYAGVENPLYSRGEGVALCLGDAKATLSNLMDRLDHAESVPTASATSSASSATSSATPLQSATEVLHNAKRVIIVPGYGMALAQAQQEVKQLADKLARGGADVKYAIHPVAGRMPGHMNVLLAEANVDYDSLYEMEAINDQFANTDAVIVIGANDVLNPAARNAEGTPIYGMPVLNVDQAKQVIICNFDLKPGYAGVENPLYSRGEGVTLLIGDAKKTLSDLIDTL
ncbi:NAD(P)(+) transhydrogenase (Re/Si-specific) subunit beta [Porphyromonas sp.]|uniref:NAD(P)(+) transhydrogenase (Re/Si-specific) subunit beta n=1 Tax=Porphyromonas sp. TaxID=1924944 RepID=UPI003A8CB6B7